MRRRSSLRLRAGVALGIAVALASGAQSSARPALADASVVGRSLQLKLAREGEARVIVAFRPRQGSPAVQAIRQRVLGRLEPVKGFRPTAAWKTVPAIAATVTSDTLARLARDPEVLRIDLDEGGRGGDAESLPLIRGDAAHAAGFTGRGVTVAVLDTGIDRAHPDLADAITGEQCFVTPNGCPNRASQQAGAGSATDAHGHGTNVAGIVTSNGTVAPIGVAPDASIVAVRVMDRDNGFQTISQIVSGLDWIAVNRPDVRVVNMSLGTFQRFAGNCDGANAGTVALASAVAALRARGVTVFASSLNDAQPASMTAPACLSGVIAVGAVYDSALGPITYPNICVDHVTAADRVTCFSNGGSELDLLAPGALIASTGRGGGVSTFAGTSQASPHAAGAAALLLQRDANLTPDSIESTLETTGVPITDARNGRTTPRIDLAAALQAPVPELPPALPNILVGRMSLVYGGVRVGRRKVLRLSVSNRGTAPLTVAATARRPFSIVAGRRLQLAPGASGVVSVAFAPAAARSYRVTLTLASNDPDRARVAVALRGTGNRRR